MAVTNLADLIQKTQFEKEVLRQALEKSVFWNAGIVQADSELGRLINANIGSTATFSYFLDPSFTVNISDDSDNKATPDNIGTGEDVTRFNYRNLSYGAKQITANLSLLGDPMVAIAGRVAAGWARDMDAMLQSQIKGILADNKANDGGDMIIETTDAVSINLILDTIQTAGDAADELFGGIIAHSAVRTALRKQGVTDKIYDANGKYLYEALSGLAMITRDGVESGVPNAGDYTTTLVGTGFAGFANGSPKVPNEVAYDALSGNGGGEEIVVSRNHTALHPYGFSQVGTPASTSPTNGEFEAEAYWDRTADRKAISLAALRAPLA